MCCSISFIWHGCPLSLWCTFFSEHPEGHPLSASSYFTGLSFSASFTDFLLFCFLSLGDCMDFMGLQYPAYADGTYILFSPTVTSPIICSSCFKKKMTHTLYSLINLFHAICLKLNFWFLPPPSMLPPMVSILFSNFNKQHHRFPGCSGSMRVSHSWFLLFLNNLYPIQPYVWTALPSMYVMHLSHRLLWLPAHQSLWDILSLHSQILALHDLKK